MTDIDKIKSKIKKLFALSKSSNPNEAANALKMAQKLMEEYAIEINDVNTIDIEEDGTKTVCRQTPTKYEAHLFEEIAKAFGCALIYYNRYNSRKSCVWNFIGLQHMVKIAAYIGQILIRKLKFARTEYIKSLYRVRSKHRKIQRADDFCFSWVYAVTKKFPEFAGVSDKELNAIEIYKNKKHNLTDLKLTNRS